MTEVSVVKPQLRATLADQCPLCPNKEFYSILELKPDIEPEHVPSAHQVMMQASPLCIMITEYQDEFKHSFQLYRCLHKECLLVHLRQSMMINWIQKKMEADDRNMQRANMMALARHKDEKSGRSRRANKRNKARLKGKK